MSDNPEDVLPACDEEHLECDHLKLDSSGVKLLGLHGQEGDIFYILSFAGLDENDDETVIHVMMPLHDITTLGQFIKDSVNEIRSRYN